ncbi:MAG TPA: hypothetical protein VGL26_07675 [Jatrophihabitans sp.]|jgi:putative spermidine/putrescine transport system permease protein
MSVAVLTPEGPPEVFDRSPRLRIPRRIGVFRPVVLFIAALYFFVPLGGALWFALYNKAQGVRLHAFTAMFSQPGFDEAFLLSLRISVLTVVFTLVLMVPTSLLIHLKLRGARRIVEIACLLPLVVPPVVLVVGVMTVLSWGPNQLEGTWPQSLINWLQNSSFPGLGTTPMILPLLYVVLALPFTYRALDAGLRTSSIGTLVEAARGLGSSWVKVIFFVALPSLRTSVLNSAFLAFAMAFGEFTVASIMQFRPFTVWIFQFNNDDGQLAVGVSILSLAITWGFLLIITAFGRTRSAKGTS